MQQIHSYKSYRNYINPSLQLQSVYFLWKEIFNLAGFIYEIYALAKKEHYLVLTIK